MGNNPLTPSTIHPFEQKQEENNDEMLRVTCHSDSATTSSSNLCHNLLLQKKGNRNVHLKILSSLNFTDFTLLMIIQNSKNVTYLFLMPLSVPMTGKNGQGKNDFIEKDKKTYVWTQ